MRSYSNKMSAKGPQTYCSTTAEDICSSIIDNCILDHNANMYTSPLFHYEYDLVSDHTAHCNDTNSTNSNFSGDNSKSRSSSCSNLNLNFINNHNVNNTDSNSNSTANIASAIYHQSGNSVGKLNLCRSNRVGIPNDVSNLFETSVPLHVQRLVQARMNEDDQHIGCDGRTTVMIRNLPNNYNQQMLLELLDGEGFAGLYDFIYLPMDFQTCACLGYAFINLVSPLLVPLFWETFDGYTKWAFHSDKIGFVSWCGPHQGLQAHIDRHRNSALMHFSVPEDYKPVVFVNGVRVPFPAPTKKLRVPRARTSRTATLPVPFAMQKPDGGA